MFLITITILFIIIIIIVFKKAHSHFRIGRIELQRGK
jgi:hypothetical protein